MKPALNLLPALLSLSLCACSVEKKAEVPEKPETPDKVRACYIGNSLTANSMPGWHIELGRSAGKQWEAYKITRGGCPLWKHALAFEENNRPQYKPFFEQKWDAITIQPFGPYLLTNKTKKVWGKEVFDEERDIGDIASASVIIDMYLERNPGGTVYIYATWPSMPPHPDKEEPDAHEYPKREDFDYDAMWTQSYRLSDRHHKGLFVPKNDSHRTRDYMHQLMDALIKKYPKLWKSGRLRMVPMGEIFFELNKAMQDGKIEGVKDIRDYYTDNQHIRKGLSRYTLAAGFYACLLRTHPDTIKWKVYNNSHTYGEDPFHDLGELIPITDANAKAVNDVIWKTVTNHPYSGLSGLQTE